MKPEQIDATLDARDLLSPIPMVRATRVMKQIPTGGVLEILVTDRGSCIDIPVWCKAFNHEVLHREEASHMYRFYVRKG
ncbi:MAG: sulfurtransferase TusA family protein [Bacillota bacterium]